MTCLFNRNLQETLVGISLYPWCHNFYFRYYYFTVELAHQETTVSYFISVAIIIIVILPFWSLPCGFTRENLIQFIPCACSHCIQLLQHTHITSDKLTRLSAGSGRYWLIHKGSYIKGHKRRQLTLFFRLQIFLGISEEDNVFVTSHIVTLFFPIIVLLCTIEHVLAIPLITTSDNPDQAACVICSLARIFAMGTCSAQQGT